MNINNLLTQLQNYTMLEAAENERIERLTVKAEGVGAIRYDKEKTQTQPALDKNETAAIELIKAKDKAARRRRERLKVRLEACDIFRQYLSSEQAYIMDLLYVHGKSVNDVSLITGLSIRWIYDIKKQSVDNLKSKMVAQSKQACYAKVEEKGYSDSYSSKA